MPPIPQLSLSQLTEAAVAEFKKATLSANQQPAEKLQKAGISTATGLVFFDLQTPSKSLFPVLTPLRNKIPRVPGNGGTATNWKSVHAINTAHLRPGVPEATRNGFLTTQVLPHAANYAFLGFEDYVTFEAELAGQNLEDVRARAAQRLLWATMIGEEKVDVGGNPGTGSGGLTLIQTPTPTAVGIDVGAGGGANDDGTYQVFCVALTHAGDDASTVSGGVVQNVVVTPADGIASTFNYGGGSAKVSAAGSTGALSAGAGRNGITAHVAAVPGAVAYAWFAGLTSGGAAAAFLQAITHINSVSITTLLLSSGQAVGDLDTASDHSTNAYDYAGLLYQAFASGSGAYIKTLATGVDGVGTVLTGDGSGGITQITDAFQYFWDNYKLTPTSIEISAQESKNITDKVLNTNGVRVNYVGDVAEIAAGKRVKTLVNPFAWGGSVEVPLNIHPNMPSGTMLFLTDTLPYPVNDVANVYEIKLRRDYYQIEWPLRTRRYESGVYFDGVLAHYFPPSLAIINNIANG